MGSDYDFPVFHMFHTFHTGASICPLASGHTDVCPLGFTEVRVPGRSTCPGVQVSLGTWPHPLTPDLPPAPRVEFMLWD